MNPYSAHLDTVLAKSLDNPFVRMVRAFFFYPEVRVRPLHARARRHRSRIVAAR